MFDERKLYRQRFTDTRLSVWFRPHGFLPDFENSSLEVSTSRSLPTFKGVRSSTRQSGGAEEELFKMVLISLAIARVGCESETVAS